MSQPSREAFGSPIEEPHDNSPMDIDSKPEKKRTFRNRKKRIGKRPIYSSHPTDEDNRYLYTGHIPQRSEIELQPMKYNKQFIQSIEPPTYNLTNPNFTQLHYSQKSNLQITPDDKQSWESIERAAEEEFAASQPTINLSESKPMISSSHITIVVVVAVFILFSIIGLYVLSRRRRKGKEGIGLGRTSTYSDYKRGTKDERVVKVRYPERAWAPSGVHSASLWSGSNGRSEGG